MDIKQLNEELSRITEEMKMDKEIALNKGLGYDIKLNLHVDEPIDYFLFLSKHNFNIEDIPLYNCATGKKIPSDVLGEEY